ncbi:glycoside hydrolase family 3 N-terminal domain-containing protein [Persicobacter psychrovividus]|uniref:beta-glucosidase n=1 Tax=Persicobacter psychrovividus TaxID=387638 RepID=A0ABM7VJM0_9BACT|nr:glycosyl hydrolase [Persicobacter psychrovividus]
MNRFQQVLILLCGIAAFSCQPSSENIQIKKAGVGIPSDQSIEKKIAQQLERLTLAEKVGQMTQITLDVITQGADEFVSDEPLALDEKLVLEAIQKYKVGSVLNTANNRARTPKKWNSVIEHLQRVSMEEIGIPLIYGVDAIHGTTYTAGATFFPQQIGLGATWNPEIVRQGAEVCAYETRASGIPWNFSPVLDMGRDARWARMWETFGEDVYLNTQLGLEVIKGYQGEDNDISKHGRVAACLKHFLGYSSLSGKDRTPALIPERELREIYLPTFQAAVDQGAYTVMINSGLINGIPVHANYQLLTELLKKEMGFDGLVVTDWADIENIHIRDKVAATQKEAVKMAINAGIDMAMVPYNYNFTTNLIELVTEGEVPMQRIDDAVSRILRVKYAMGLFEKPMDKQEEYPEFASEKFEQSALEAARESITLLKNNEQVLPLKKGTKVFVTGPNAHSMRTLNGGWTYSWQGEKVDEFAGKYQSILTAIQAVNGTGNVSYQPTVEYPAEGTYDVDHLRDLNKAKRMAKAADVIVLCLGENTYTEKPGDLHDLNISENQQLLAKEMAKLGKPIVLVLNEGRPRLISTFETQMDAVLQTYLPGNFGGQALAEILFGEVNPSGKLPYTYPKYANSLLTYDHKYAENQEKMEGMYDYESLMEVQYPFGHGLSYADFEYRDLTLSKTTFTAEETIEVSVKVKNNSAIAGKEVVQLYISDHYASLAPSVKKLKRFEKIHLAAQEERTIRFTLQGRDLAFVGFNNEWISEKGDFSIMVDQLKQDFYLSETKTYNQVQSLAL